MTSYYTCVVRPQLEYGCLIGKNDCGNCEFCDDIKEEDYVDDDGYHRLFYVVCKFGDDDEKDE
jgi:hypothetical protein